eukprot:TRINITY_DN13221_c0_g1_i1.p1 TRINITY_DN13221_c0_g1~~TRINITY_DN13221_c0_g1_i1.p1  ORF type:complete len:596 (+),score=159.56 TRINITY_DN13221_c0_g1_i1:115-1902(+)
MCIRDRGSYSSHQELSGLAARFDVPLTKQLSLSELELEPGCTVSALAAAVRPWVNQEGVVLMMPDGQMFKIKSAWYTHMAAAATRGGKQGGARFLPELLAQNSDMGAVPTAAVWGCVLGEQADDTVALCCSMLVEAGQHGHALHLKSFQSQVDQGINTLHEALSLWGSAIQTTLQTGGSLMDAVSSAALAGWQTSLLVGYCKAGQSEGHARSELLAQLRKLCVEQRTQTLENLLDCEWGAPREFSHNGAELERSTIGEEVFATAREACGHKLMARIREHVCNEYLNRKVANMLGKHTNDMDDTSTLLLIPPEHKPDEGKLKGAWELFANDGVIDLRVDLQPSKHSGYDDHYGDRRFANIQVQFGASDVCKKSSRRTNKAHLSGGFAGILVATGVEHTLGHLRAAMELSFDTGAYVKLHPSGQGDAGTKASEVQIFCDLDGVLADFATGLDEAGQCDMRHCGEAHKWATIQRTPRFFGTLPWCERGGALWELLLSLPGKGPVKILSATPGAKLGKRVDKDKRAWCKNNLGASVEVLTCLSEHKGKYSAHGHVLIDDSLKHKLPWEAQGGMFIHHTCLLYTSPSPRDRTRSRMPSSA